MDEKILYVVMPAYNEAPNIKDTIRDWYPVVEKHNGQGKSRLLIINDGSKDNTIELIKQEIESRPLLEVMDKKNEGHGPSIIRGYKYAIEKGADYIFQTDSDGQTSTEEFEEFWNLRHNSAVIGIKESRPDGRFRKFVDESLKLFIWMIYGVRLPDVNTPYRLMHREYLEKYLCKIPDNYDFPNILLTIYGAYFREKITFSMIRIKERTGGSSHLHIRRLSNRG